jgi:hypothetical protein
MKKLIWFASGIAAGLFVAKQLRENPQAQELVDDATKRAKEFGAAVSEGFREREAELAVSAKPVAAKRAIAKKTTAKKPAAAKRPAAKKAPATKPVSKPSAN